MPALSRLTAVHLNRVGIGGLDLGGDSPGFDLDAIGVTNVPEPSALILVGSGLVGLGWWRRMSGARR